MLVTQTVEPIVPPRIEYDGESKRKEVVGFTSRHPLDDYKFEMKYNAKLEALRNMDPY
jgi:hypothetical protein